MSAYSYAKLPRGGLGNMLLVWARAFVFARQNRLPLIVSRWGHLKTGSILRREVRHRIYVGYFKPHQPVNILKKQFVLWTYKQRVEPEIGNSAANHPSERTLYIFKSVPDWRDFFAGLRDHRDAIRDAIHDMLAPKHRQTLAILTPPVIGIHVRLGDFRKLEPGEDFSR